MNFIERLTSARRQAALTQAQLATRLGVTRESVARYETGKQAMTVFQLQKFADAVGVPASWFFESEASLPRMAYDAQAVAEGGEPGGRVQRAWAQVSRFQGELNRALAELDAALHEQQGSSGF